MARRRVIVGLYLVAFLAMMTLVAISPRPGAGWINPRHDLVFDAIPLTREHVMTGLMVVATLCWLVAAGLTWRSWSRRRMSPRQ